MCPEIQGATSGIDRDRIDVISNGVDCNIFSPDARAPLILPTRYIASVGSYVPWKGHKLLIEAFFDLADKFPDVSVVIAGMDGPERKNLLELASRLGISSRLHCLVGLTPREVAATLAQAEMCVQPSLRESFGIAVIEAGACATPIIASSVGGHMELIKHGVTGYLFPSMDRKACTDAIEQVLNNQEEAQTVAYRFHRKVTSNYTWSTTAQRYASLFWRAR